MNLSHTGFKSNDVECAEFRAKTKINGQSLSSSLSVFSGGQQGDPGGPAEVWPHANLPACQLPDSQC